MSVTLTPVRRTRRKTPAQVGNVVRLHAPVETTEDIVRDVQERSLRQELEISALLHQAVAEVDVRHRDHAKQCSSIGYAMDRPTLDAWIEIGQRMLGKGKRA